MDEDTTIWAANSDKGPRARTKNKSKNEASASSHESRLLYLPLFKPCDEDLVVALTNACEKAQQ